MNEQLLRDLLHDTADRPVPTMFDDDSAVDAVIAARRVQRRNRARALVAAACVAVVALVVPFVWPDGRSTTPDRETAGGSPAFDWPPRGSLADDPATVDAVLALPALSHGATALTEPRVAFVGDVPGVARFALVIGQDRSGADAGQWLAGPVGAAPAALEPDRGPEPLADARSVSHVSGDGTTLLVVAAPGDTVEVSGGVLVETDGSVRRDYTPVETVDGVAVTTLEPSTEYGPSTIYRVLQDGETVDSRSAPVPGFQLSAVDPPLLVPLDPLSEPAAPEAVEMATGVVVAQVGLPLDRLRLDLVYSGPLFGPTAEPVDAVVLAVTLPNGAVVVSTAWSDIAESGAGTAGTCGMQSHPAGTPLDQLSVAAVCTPVETAPERALMTYAARSATAFEVEDSDGHVVSGGSPGGIATVWPAPARAILRVVTPEAEIVEQAVVDAVPDQIVDLAGRGVDD